MSACDGHSCERIANLINIKVVAEGIEQEKDLKFLKNKGCDYYQGYYFSHPKKPQEILDIHKSSNKKPSKPIQQPQQQELEDLN